MIPAMTQTHPRLAAAAALVLVLVLDFSSALAQDLEPIDPALLQGQRLVLDKLNCSIEAPNDEWQWTGKLPQTDPTVHAYVCQSRAGETLTLRVRSGDHPDLNDLTAGDALASTALPYEAQGLFVSLDRRDRADMPVPGKSYFFESRVTNKAGTGYLFGYLGSGIFLYEVSALVGYPEEPAWLGACASSFKLLRPPRREKIEGFSVGRLLWRLTLGGMVIAFGLWFARRQGLI